MRLSDLRQKKIKTLDGDTVGRVHEVHSDKGKIVALMSGPASLIERWTAREAGRRIPWADVQRIEQDAIVITPSGSSRQG